MRAIKIGGTRRTVYGPADDHYFRTIDLTGRSERAFTHLVKTALPRDAVVFDVGANIGITALQFSAACKGPVYAFEPHPEVRPHLARTLEANGCTNVRLVPLALGAEPGRVGFSYNGHASGMSHLIGPGSVEATADTEVEVTTLDAFVEGEGIERLDFIKIDVEGFEPDVIAGAAATLQRLKPAVFVEYNAYTLVAFRDISPRLFLWQLADTFPYIYRFNDARPARVDGKEALGVLLRDTMHRKGCMNDLYCAFAPLPAG